MISCVRVVEGAVEWDTVAAAWGLSTLTTIIIVAVTAYIIHRRPCVSTDRDKLERDDPIRESSKSTNTRITVISHENPNGKNHRYGSSTSNRTSGQSLQSQVSSPRTPLDPNPGRHMPRSISEEVAPVKSRRTSDQTSKWCTQHGLPERVAAVLREQGFHSAVFLESLRADDVPSLGLHSIAEECLLRNALEKKWSEKNSSESSGIATSSTRVKKSQSNDQLKKQPSLESDVQEPLLDRALSFNDIDECDGLQDFADLNSGKKSRPQNNFHLRPVPKKKPNLQFHGLFSDQGLYNIANELGNEWQQLATLLGVPPPIQEQIKLNNPFNARQQIFQMLLTWRDSAKGDKPQIKGTLHQSLMRVQRADLADWIKQEEVDGSVERVNISHSVV